VTLGDAQTAREATLGNLAASRGISRHLVAVRGACLPHPVCPPHSRSVTSRTPSRATASKLKTSRIIRISGTGDGCCDRAAAAATAAAEAAAAAAAAGLALPAELGAVTLGGSGRSIWKHGEALSQLTPVRQ
jgi:hypothetical protein